MHQGTKSLVSLVHEEETYIAQQLELLCLSSAIALNILVGGVPSVSRPVGSHHA